MFDKDLFSPWKTPMWVQLLELPAIYNTERGVKKFPLPVLPRMIYLQKKRFCNSVFLLKLQMFLSFSHLQAFGYWNLIKGRSGIIWFPPVNNCENFSIEVKLRLNATWQEISLWLMVSQKLEQWRKASTDSQGDVTGEPGLCVIFWLLQLKEVGVRVTHCSC